MRIPCTRKRWDLGDARGSAGLQDGPRRWWRWAAAATQRRGHPPCVLPLRSAVPGRWRRLQKTKERAACQRPDPAAGLQTGSRLRSFATPCTTACLAVAVSLPDTSSRPASGTGPASRCSLPMPWEKRKASCGWWCECAHSMAEGRACESVVAAVKPAAGLAFVTDFVQAALDEGEAVHGRCRRWQGARVRHAECCWLAAPLSLAVREKRGGWAARRRRQQLSPEARLKGD